MIHGANSVTAIKPIGKSNISDADEKARLRKIYELAVDEKKEPCFGKVVKEFDDLKRSFRQISIDIEDSNQPVEVEQEIIDTPYNRYMTASATKTREVVDDDIEEDDGDDDDEVVGFVEPIRKTGKPLPKKRGRKPKAHVSVAPTVAKPEAVEA